MGCVASSAAEPEELVDKQRLVSSAIDRTLNQKNKSNANQIRMFLLGPGESGKSTVLKQMRLLHNHSFSNFERKNYSTVIWVDMIESMKLLLLNARKFQIPLDCDRPGSPLVAHKRVIINASGLNKDDTLVNDYAISYNQKKSKINDDGDFESNSLLSFESSSVASTDLPQSSRQEIAQAIHELWTKDSGIRACFEQSNRFQLESSAKYYFDNAFNFSNPRYLCSDQDIIMGRIKTTGITENTFQVRDTTLKVLDAGGQRSERKKWIHFFHDINAIIFVLAVSEYDQTLYEDARVNRIDEALTLFEALCNSPWFTNTPFILFLNKVDLLERKLTLSPFTQYFPEFEKNQEDVEQVLDFLERKILSLNRTRKPIYVHRTCATDTNTMKFVLNAVTDMMIQQNLKRSGIM